MALLRAFILILAAALELWGIQGSGYSNAFYASAVKSMSENWHAFFFASFDPAGFITVDKPPFALWVQVAFVKLLGYKGWAFLLPEALAQVFSVELLYRMLKKGWGEIAGLSGALALALAPAMVAVARTNNMDAVLIALLMLASWSFLRSIETRGWKSLLLSAVFMGLAFNTKTLQAFIILPALAIAYALCAREKFSRRFWKLLAAGALLCVMSFSWIFAVDLVPAANRPYVGSTQDDSELSLAVGYNGLARIEGTVTGNGSQAAGAKSGSASSTAVAFGNAADSASSSAAFAQPPASAASAASSSIAAASGAADGFGGGPGAMPGAAGTTGGGMQGVGFGGGSAGVFRLFNEELGSQTGWLIPFAFVSLAGSLSMIGWRKLFKREYSAGETSALYFGLWFLAGFGVLSIAGFEHPYYTATLAPAISALFGIGSASLWRFYESGTKRLAWRAWLLPFALVLSALGQSCILFAYSAYRPLLMIVLAIELCAAFVLTVGLIGIGKLRLSKLLRPAAALGIAGLLLAPATWSAYAATHAVNATIPFAGPEATSAEGGGFGGSAGTGGGFGGGSTTDTALIVYLEANQGNATYLAAAQSTQTAAPIIIATGKPVMAIGGFTGSDPSLTLDEFKALVQKGTVRYYIGGGLGGPGGGSSSIASWVQSSCKAVSYSSATASNSDQRGGSTTLYACSQAA